MFTKNLIRFYNAIFYTALVSYLILFINIFISVTMILIGNQTGAGILWYLQIPFVVLSLLFGIISGFIRYNPF